jgi:hypothetical protein
MFVPIAFDGELKLKTLPTCVGVFFIIERDVVSLGDVAEKDANHERTAPKCEP